MNAVCVSTLRIRALVYQAFADLGSNFMAMSQVMIASSWSEPLRVDNELSNINSWREVYEKDEAALRPSIQDISSSRT